jgi:hypothetical protein
MIFLTGEKTKQSLSNIEINGKHSFSQKSNLNMKIVLEFSDPFLRIISIE